MAVDKLTKNAELITNSSPYTSFASATSSATPNLDHPAFYQIQYTGADANAPDTSSNAWQWNVWDFGTDTRRTQIAVCPFRYRGEIFMRQKHDTTWHGWYKLPNAADFVVDSATSGSQTLNHNSASAYSFSIAKAGYTPLCISGSSFDGTNAAFLSPSIMYISGNNAIFTIYNTSTTVNVTFTITARVLYIKSGS